jgi:hypothetical protein
VLALIVVPCDMILRLGGTLEELMFANFLLSCISLLAFCTFAQTAQSQSDHAAAPPVAKAAAKATPTTMPDPYAPLQLYDGKWDVLPPEGEKSAETMHLENRCARVGEFFACNQFLNGKNSALVVFLPVRALESGGYSYRNQALRPENDGSATWGNLEIVGDRWVYSSEETDKGKKIFWRTTNIFSGADKIHFEVQRSEDGSNWTTNMSGNEARTK